MSAVKACTFLEIDLKRCANVYGVGPCTAAIGVTGDIKCFNSIRTCQDRVNYAEEIETARFAVPDPQLSNAYDYRPFIKGQPSYTPATVSLGKDLGVRASLAVTFQDAPDPDTGPGGDRYVAERGYDPFALGTFFGKFRARFPYFRGLAVRLIRGEVGQAIADMRTWHFIGESFDGPRPDGTFSIMAKDILKLADNDRALAPSPSLGTVLTPISAVDVFLPMQPGAAALYAAAGAVCIGGNEIALYTRGPGGNDANVVILLHFDGADGAATTGAIIDSGPNGFAAASITNAQLDDDGYVAFGTTSLTSTGTGSVTWNDNAAFTMGTADWTIDVRVQLSSLAAARMIASHGNNEANNNNAWRWSVTTAGELSLTITSGGSTLLNFVSSGAGLTTGVPYHLAVERFGNVWTFFVNGVAVATTTVSLTVPNYTGNFRIMLANDGTTAPFAGWVDEFRWSNVARYSGAAFTPYPLAYNAATANDLVMSQRGAFNTTAIAHNAEERVQQCLIYDAMKPDLIIADLFTTYSPGIQPGNIPSDAWAAEVDAYLQRVYSAVITEPTGVNALVSELVEQAALAIWPEPESNTIELRVLRNVSPDATPITDDRYMRATLQSREQPELRISQVWTHYAQRDPTKPLTDKYNYKSVRVGIDPEAEADHGTSVVKRVYSRWIPEFGSAIADRVNDLQLGRYRDPPRRFNFDFFRGAEPDGLISGAGFYLQAPSLQDATGARALVPIQITRVAPENARFKVEAEEATFAQLDPVDLFNRVITIDANVFNFNLLEVHDNLFPEITDPYGIKLTLIIQPGVTVGSLSTSLPALTVGDFVMGLPITIRNLGRIQGKGGNGALVDQSGTIQTPGQQGGTAIYTRRAINLDLNGDGEVKGGGGGGGASYHSVFYPGNPYASGSYVYWAPGAGGEGTQPGAGGVGNYKPGGGAWVDLSADPGTTEAGGLADHTYGPSNSGYTSSGFAQVSGGDGGDAGQAGDLGTSPGSGPTGGTFLVARGAAGNAIDGDSYVTVTVAGIIEGPQIN